MAAPTSGKQDSVLLGAIGGPKWEGLPGPQRPEKGLLRLREGMELFANDRPAKIWPQLADASPLKKEITDKGIDFVIVRELIGGAYFGKKETKEVDGELVAVDEMPYSEHEIERIGRIGFETARKRRKKLVMVDGKKETKEVDGELVAVDEMPYSEHEIERIGRIGFETARKRRKKLVMVDKHNVLDTSRLWVKVFDRLKEEYLDVEYSTMFVDNAAMQIVKDPSQFDVIVTENLFGDILSDEASQITGSIGMIPSSSRGMTKNGLYEPIHGSAPDIAGQDKVNPIACILSAALMLRYGLDMEEEAARIEQAVEKVLDQGYRTADIWTEGTTLVGTKEMGDRILENL